MRQRGATDPITVVLLILAVLVVFGVLKPFAAVPLSGGGGGGDGRSGADLTFCGGLNTVSVFASERNKANVSASFLPGAFRAANNGRPTSIVATATGTEGTTETLTTLSIPCGLENKAGHIYAVSDSSNNGHYLGTYDFEGKRTVKGEGSAGDELRIIIRNLAGTNLSDDTSSGVEDPTETTAVALAAGGTRSLRVDIEGGNVGGTQYGSDLGVWVMVDYIRPAAIAQVNFAGPGIVEIVNCDPANLPSAYAALGMQWPTGFKDTLAKAVGVDSADRCYLMTKQGSGDATRVTSVSEVAGSTDPATTDDPTLTFRDVNYFEYQGEIMAGGIDPAGTDVGQSNSVVTINNS